MTAPARPLIVRTLRCPGCNALPRIFLNPEQAFCGNDDCSTVCWNATDPPGRHKANVTVMDAGQWPFAGEEWRADPPPGEGSPEDVAIEAKLRQLVHLLGAVCGGGCPTCNPGPIGLGLGPCRACGHEHVGSTGAGCTACDCLAWRPALATSAAVGRVMAAEQATGAHHCLDALDALVIGHHLRALDAAVHQTYGWDHPFPILASVVFAPDRDDRAMATQVLALPQSFWLAHEARPLDCLLALALHAEAAPINLLTFARDHGAPTTRPPVAWMLLREHPDGDGRMGTAVDVDGRVYRLHHARATDAVAGAMHPATANPPVLDVAAHHLRRLVRAPMPLLYERGHPVHED